MNIDHCYREASDHEFTAVAVQDSPVKQEILDVTAVDKEANIVAIGPGQFWQRDEAGHFKVQITCLDGNHFLGGSEAVDSCDGLAEISRPCRPCHFMPVIDQGKGNLWMG